MKIPPKKNSFLHEILDLLLENLHYSHKQPSRLSEEAAKRVLWDYFSWKKWADMTQFFLTHTDEPDPKPIFGKQILEWEEDVQLYSRFLDRKEELRADHATYIRRHPDVRIILADFLQFLLLRKPDDIVAFAAEFFAPFAAQRSPTNTFHTSYEPSPFRSSCQ